MSEPSMIDMMSEREVRSACKELSIDVERKRKRIAELEEALKSIVGQTDDCETDETYHCGVWREVNYTAKAALKEQE